MDPTIFYILGGLLLVLIFLVVRQQQGNAPAGVPDKTNFVSKELYDAILSQNEQLRGTLAGKEQELRDAHAQLAAREQQIFHLESTLRTRKEEVEQLQARFKTEFENIASRLLEEKS